MKPTCNRYGCETNGEGPVYVLLPVAVVGSQGFVVLLNLDATGMASELMGSG